MLERIRIAFVVYSFQAGGLERCVAHFVNNLDRSRFEPLVICLSRNGGAAKWIERDDVPIIELNKRDGNDVRVIGRLVRALRENKIELIHSHNWGTLLETTLARRAAMTPYHVHAEHGQELDAMRAPGLKQRLRNLARRWAFSRTDAVVACAQSVVQRIHRKWGYPESKVEFIANGVETPAYTRADNVRETLRREFGLPPTSVVVGSIGRLVAIKNFENAIAAVGLLAKRSLDIHLVLVGDGPERDHLERTIPDFLTERVHFVGFREDIGDCLRLFDVYVNSSLGEAMNMAILEAMAVGLPIIATDVGDNASLLNGSRPCGVVVPPADPKKLADAIQRVVENDDERTVLGSRAKQRYESRYSVDSMVHHYEQLYLRICGRAAALEKVVGRT